MADLEVSPEVWRTHASHVDQIKDGLGEVTSASQAAMAGLPFGVLCSPLFLPPYEIAKTGFDSGVSTVSERIGTGASSVRQVASSFETTDTEAASQGGGPGAPPRGWWCPRPPHHRSSQAETPLLALAHRLMDAQRLRERHVLVRLTGVATRDGPLPDAVALGHALGLERGNPGPRP